MNKNNILYGITGILSGLIIGFLFANSYLRSELMSGKVSAAPTAQQNPNVPEGHPDISAQLMNAAAKSEPVPPETQSAFDFAKANPNDFEAQTKAAELLTQSELYDEAMEVLKNANKLKPDDYTTIVNLGNASFDSGNLEEAEKWYSAALQKKKDDHNVRTDLGLTFVFRKTPDYDRAIQEFSTVLASEPNHIQSLQNSVVAYMRKGDAIKAQENLAKLEAVDPKNTAVARLKEQLKKMGAN